MSYKMKNTDSFILLYCKKWVKDRINPIDDLRKLSANWAAIDTEFVDEDFIISVMFQLVEKYAKPYYISLLRFINDISPTECWKFGYYTKDTIYESSTMKKTYPDYNYKHAIIYKFKSILCLIKVWDNDKELIVIDEYSDIQEKMMEILDKND